MRHIRLLFLFGSFIFLMGNASLAQNKIISGSVTDNKGAPLAGATVMVKGTSVSTPTDSKGAFSLSVSSSAQVILNISYVGHESLEYPVGSDLIIRVSLNPTGTNMGEVVVIGYGTQKKANLTGAVGTISGNELTQRPVQNVANLLQGRMAGVFVNQGSAQPGKENSSIRIRGIGTFSSAGNDPLVIVDGVAGFLDNIDPQNIESITVLKDAASASIYGARAANGVIVVTTKKGSNNSLNVAYNVNYGRQSATMLPDFVSNSVEYMQMWNKAHSRQNVPNLFDQSVIDAYKNAGPNDPQYPNFNWMDHVFRNVPAVKNDLIISGGNDKIRFHSQFGIYDQKGIAIGHDYKRYTGQLNFEAKINRSITFGTNISVAFGKRKEPWLFDSDFILLAYGSQPMYTPYLPGGKRYSHGAWPEKWVNRNPELVANEGGRFFESQNIRALSYLNVKILPELTWQIKGSIDYTNTFQKIVQYPVQTYSFGTGEPYSNGWPTQLGVEDRYQNNKLPTFFTTIDYKKTLSNKHNLGLLGGYNREYFFDRNLMGYRRDFTFASLQQLNAGTTNVAFNSGTANEWAIESFFGRATYNYDEKYFLEANLRYDGTSRINKENRWGLFPSLSAGWRVSEEKFMENYKWVDNLKLRGSWGMLGNQNIGNYPYQDMLGLATYPIGTTLDQGVVQTRLYDKNLSWETTTSTDIGVEMSVGKGIFSFEFDWYKKATDGILAQAQIPASVGLSPPTTNFASMENTGIELLIGHKKTIGEITYSVSLNFSTNRNIVTKVFAPIRGLRSVVEGEPINSYYMLLWDGIFQNQAEINAAPVHQGNPQPGDLRFKDISGPDGKPDNRIDANDRTIIAGAQPKFSYGGSINLQWRNWDLSAFLQGVQGTKQYLTWWGRWPFTQGTPPTTDWRNAWTPENKSQTMPALWSFSTYGYVPMSGAANSFDLQDASYLRLKNLRIGYNLPIGILKKIRLKETSLYFSGDNLFTSTNMKYVDPERADNQTRGSVYPQAKTISFGFNTKF